MGTPLSISAKDRQKKAEELTARIKQMNKLLAGEETYTAAVDLTLEIPRTNWIDKSYGWLSPEALENWYNSNRFRKKYQDLIRLLKWWEKQSNLWHIETRGSVTTGYFTDFQKMDLFHEVMHLADSLSKNFDSRLEGRFYQLEIELYKCLSPQEISILRLSGDNTKNQSFLFLFKKFLRSDLILLLRIMFIRIKRDLRKLFRNIVHFLFKNMSDESDANDFLFKLFLDKKFVISQCKIYEHQRNNSILKANT
jgi:hypothetical protein